MKILQPKYNVKFISVVAQPTNLATSNITATSLTVTWTESKDGGGAVTIGGYVIEWWSENKDGKINVEQDKCCKHLLENKKSNTRYFLTITARTKQENRGMVSETLEAITCKLFFATKIAMTNVLD